MELHIPDTIKVHFAGLENNNFITAVSEMGVQYGLYTAFPFVYRKLFSKNKGRGANLVDIPRKINGKMRHTIQDSGLFSLLYGAHAKLANSKTVYKWYDALVEWTLQHGQDVTCVEVDCQDILGQDEAWEFRERMRRDLPNNRIINVFHLSDEVKGLDRLIEFSDYIGVGSGTPNNSSATMFEVASYIKERKPECDIHLLGCTNLKTIRRCNFCTSCDSVSWKSPMRFGHIMGYHISDLDTAKIQDMVGQETWDSIRKVGSEQSTNAFCASIELYKRQYEKSAGNQDYTKYFKTKQERQNEKQ